MKKNYLELLTIITLLTATSCNINEVISNEVSKYETSTSQEKSTSSISKSSIEESSSSVEETSSGSDTSSTGITTHEHDYPNKDDYMTLQECSVCHKLGRIEPTNEFLEIFKDTYQEEFKTNAKALTEECEELVNSSKDITDKIRLEEIKNTLKTKIDELYCLAITIGDGYTYAELKSYYTNEDYWNDRYEEIYAAYQQAKTNYYVILNHIFYSPLKEIYFEGEDLEKLEKMLAPYEDDTLATLEAEIKELENEAFYEHIGSDYFFNQDVYNLIDKRNQLATLNGYDNYYDYAYANEYDRKYDSTNISLYREYVKEYLVPALSTIIQAYQTNYNKVSLATDKYILSPCFDNEDAMNLLANYYKTMTSSKYDVNMYDTINKAFKEGRVFIGNGKEVAFTNNFNDLGNYMLFDNIDYYAGSLAFTHECGHYMIDYGAMPCNDYDLMETHSQSNEAMYINYLKNVVSNSVFTCLEIYYAYRVLSSAISTCMIDEIEECLYKNYCGYSDSLKDGISKSEYSTLVNAIQAVYGVSAASNWKYYFTQSTCYEVSYGISTLPCFGLYLSAKTDEAKAKESYFDCMNFYKDEEFTNNYDINDFTYLDVLEYAGYMNSFDEDLFELIATNIG